MCVLWILLRVLLWRSTTQSPSGTTCSLQHLFCDQSIMSGPRKPSYLLPCILQTKGSHCGNSTQLSGAVRLLVPETEPVQCRMGRGRAPGACWLAKSLTEGLNLTCQVLPPRQHDSCFLLKRKGQILASSVVMHFSGAMNSRLSGVFIKSETQ